MPSYDLLHHTAQEQHLTDLELRFVMQYLIHFNAKRAAAEAGYNSDRPGGIAAELLHKPYIVNVIKQRMKDMVMDADEALARLAAIARADITDFYTLNPATGFWEPDIQRIKDSGMGFLVRKIEQNRFGTLNVEFYSATEAIQLIAKNLGLLKDVPQINLNVALGEWAQFVKKARELPQPVSKLPPGAEEAYAKLRRDVANADIDPMSIGHSIDSIGDPTQPLPDSTLADIIDGTFTDKPTTETD
jgi:hypothetical protein